MPSKEGRAKHLISMLETPTKELTPRQAQFLESVSDQFDRKGTLSEKQMEILEQIYTEKG